MKSNLLFSFILCSLLFPACEQAPEKQTDMSQVRSEIQELENAWANALNTKDIDSLMELYAENAVSMANDGPTLTGKAAIRKFQEEEWKSPSPGTFSFETKDVYGDGKVVTEVGTTTVKDASGKVTSTGKYMAVFEKQDGKYRCIREIYNNDQKSDNAIAATKSIHLFDLPKDVNEAQWSAALKEMNTTIAGLGYPGAGYFLYKTEDKEIKKNRYFFEGVWPSEAAYKEIHESQAFLDTDKKVNVLYEKIKPVEIYRRMTLVK